MLTNPWETEVVGSLGVKLANGRESRCPMGFDDFTPLFSRARLPPKSPPAPAWTAGALARLDRIPEMVRPMAREGIERYAKNAGRGVVDEALLEEARAAFAS